VGVVRVQRLCQQNDSLLQSKLSCPHNINKGVTNESILQIIAYDTALSISYLWTPKYHLRILTGQVAEEAGKCVRAFSEQKSCEVVELNIQIDHVYLPVMVVSRISISDFVGMVKGRIAIRVFNEFRHLK
jgi:hypothetical protein